MDGCALCLPSTERKSSLFLRVHHPETSDHSYPCEAGFHINLPVLFFSVSLAVLSGVIFG
jgi:hypothetical protein